MSLQTLFTKVQLGVERKFCIYGTYSILVEYHQSNNKAKYDYNKQ